MNVITAIKKPAKIENTVTIVLIASLFPETKGCKK